MTPETIRQSDAYRVVTPEQAIEIAQGLGDHSVLYLNPILAGIDPKTSWEMLRLFEDEVLPHITPGPMVR